MLRLQKTLQRADGGVGGGRKEELLRIAAVGLLSKLLASFLKAQVQLLYVNQAMQVDMREITKKVLRPYAKPLFLKMRVN